MTDDFSSFSVVATLFLISIGVLLGYYFPLAPPLQFVSEKGEDSSKEGSNKPHRTISPEASREARPKVPPIDGIRLAAPREQEIQGAQKPRTVMRGLHDFSWKRPPESLPLSDEELKFQAQVKERVGADRWDSAPESMRVRYLRSFVTEKDPLGMTVHGFNSTLDWRKAENIDAILPTMDPTHLQNFRTLWPSAIHGFDKFGRPVMFERAAFATPKEILKLFTQEQCLQMHLHLLERNEQVRECLSAARGFLVYKSTVVVDLKGLSSAHLTGAFWKIFRSGADMTSQHYSEGLALCVVINVPSFFKMTWTLISRFLHPLTVARIKLSSGNEALFEVMDIDMIPHSMGGDCKCGEFCCSKDFYALNNIDLQ